MEMTELEEKLELLKELEYNGKYSNENIKNTMKEVVTTYREPEEVNKKVKIEKEETEKIYTEEYMLQGKVC